MAPSWTMFLAGFVAGVAVVLGMFFQGVPLKLSIPKSQIDSTPYHEPLPWPIFQAIMSIVPRLQGASRSALPPFFALLEDSPMLFSGALCSLVDLDVARTIDRYTSSTGKTSSKKGMPLDELARALGVQRVQVLGRIIRFASIRGYFYLDSTTQLVYNTPKSSYLSAATDAPIHFLCVASRMNTHALLSPTGSEFPSVENETLDSYLVAYLKQDPQAPSKPLLSHSFDGLNYWAILERYGLRASFDQFMTFLSRASPNHYDYPFDRNCDTVVDIAGGVGHLLYDVLKTYPGVKRGVLFELEEQINRAKEFWQSGDVGAALVHKVNFVAGDLFDAESYPNQAAGAESGRTCYMLRQILHNWPDQDASTILFNVAARMKENDKLLINEMFPSDELDLTDEPRVTFDMYMLLCCESSERSYRSMDELLVKAGLKAGQMFETRSPYRWLEVTKQIA